MIGYSSAKVEGQERAASEIDEQISKKEMPKCSVLIWI
jgi:hypothetical protein